MSYIYLATETPSQVQQWKLINVHVDVLKREEIKGGGGAREYERIEESERKGMFFVVFSMVHRRKWQAVLTA